VLLLQVLRFGTYTHNHHEVIHIRRCGSHAAGLLCSWYVALVDDVFDQPAPSGVGTMPATALLLINHYLS
jgi:hypothetical protein